VSDDVDKNPTVTTALLACIEYIQAENERLKASQPSRQHLRLKHMHHDDRLVRLFTRFACLLYFFIFWDLLLTTLNIEDRGKVTDKGNAKENLILKISFFLH